MSITAMGRDENACADNAFSVFPGGGSPLHIEGQPGDVNAQESEGVNFRLEVPGGRRPFACQRRTWDPGHGKRVDLPGFAEPSLIRKDIGKMWSGAKLRCVAADAEGTQIISRGPPGR